MCDKWAERGRGVPKLGLAAMLSLKLGRRWKEGEGTWSSALSKTDRSVARREHVGLCATFAAEGMTDVATRGLVK
jgi:hypothetical protein